MSKFLVVDDNEQNRYLLRVLLEGHGHDVALAENGKEAINEARNTPPDIIVTDILMPVMDGFVLCRNWKQDIELKHIPFVFYTATYTQPKDREFALSLGAERFIIKPQEPEILLDMLLDTLDEFQGKQVGSTSSKLEDPETFVEEHYAIVGQKLEDKLKELEETNRALEHEIVEHKKTEQALIKSIEKLADAQAIAHLGNWVWNIEENVLTWSDEIYRIFGLAPQQFEASYESFLESVHPEDRQIVDRCIREALEKGEPYNLDHRIVHPDGTERIVHEQGRLVYDEGGKPVQMLGTVQDITERKKIEEELEKHRNHLEEIVATRTAELKQANARLQELDRMKDEFVSNVSHELRAPITNIKLHLHMLQAKPDKQAVYVDTLERESRRLEQLVENLLHVSRIDQGQIVHMFAPTDLNSLVKIYFADRTPVAESQGLNLLFEPEEDLPEVNIDIKQLGQVISIILTNAFNYTPEGGEVTIKTQTRQGDTGQWVGFSISDTGQGIGSDDIDQIFNRFFRGEAGQLSDTPGTGLGLSIASEIVKQHQGLLEVESDGTPGKGSTFTVWLPENTALAD